MGRVRGGPINDSLSSSGRGAVRFSVEGNPFEPDILLAVQMVRATVPQPERRLMVAVLERAVDDLTTARMSNDGHAAAKLRDEALRYFESTERDWPFAFANVCEHLGLEPGPIRRAMALAAATQQRVALPARRRIAGDRHVVGAA